MNKQTSDGRKSKEHDPFLCEIDDCTVDIETGLFSIIYSEDG